MSMATPNIKGRGGPGGAAGSLRCPSCGQPAGRRLRALSARAVSTYYRCENCSCIFSVGDGDGTPVPVIGCWPAAKDRRAT